MKRYPRPTQFVEEEDEKDEKRARSESPSRSSRSFRRSKSLPLSKSLPRVDSLSGTSQATTPSNISTHIPSAILQTITPTQPLQTSVCSSQISMTCSAPCN